MNNLIKVKQNENGDLLVNARDLYDGLKIGLTTTKYTDWILKQLENVGGIEGTDFFVLKRQTNGRPMTEHILKLDIAKEICMVVGVAPRTNKETKELSKKVRKYFIECERQLKIQITNNTELYNIIVDLKKEIQELKEEIKVIKGDTVEDKVIKQESNIDKLTKAIKDLDRKTELTKKEFALILNSYIDDRHIGIKILNEILANNNMIRGNDIITDFAKENKYLIKKKTKTTNKVYITKKGMMYIISLL